MQVVQNSKWKKQNILGAIYVVSNLITSCGDYLVDYTIELSNQGGGCGGNIGQQERWTLFGTKPDKFIWTHIIPYRSESGKWEKM